MDRSRRNIEIDEDVAAALERRAAERGMSLGDFLSEVGGNRDQAVVTLSSEELAELDARIDEWERDRLGYDAHEMFDWLKARVDGRDTPRPRLRRF